MSNRLYVGNLSFQISEDELGKVFSDFGEVVSANIIRDFNSGRSKGFGFVEMKNSADAENAIKELNGREVEGRAIIVNVAREKERNSSSKGNFRRNNRY